MDEVSNDELANPLPWPHLFEQAYRFSGCGSRVEFERRVADFLNKEFEDAKAQNG